MEKRCSYTKIQEREQMSSRKLQTNHFNQHPLQMYMEDNRNEINKLFLEKQIVPPQYHGFLPKKCILTNPISRLQKWTLSDDSQEPVDIVYLDLEMAFDEMPIPYLFYKLEHFEVREDLLSV